MRGAVVSYVAAALESCEFNSGGGDDLLVVDISNGVPGAYGGVGGVTFTAGTGNDALVLTGISASENVQVQMNQVGLLGGVIGYTGGETVRLEALPGVGVVNV